MLFRNEESSLRLDIVNYEFPPDGGDPTSDDRNWLVLRATWNKEDGDVVKDFQQLPADPRAPEHERRAESAEGWNPGCVRQ